MTHIEIFILALALSVDAFVVSFSYGISELKNRRKSCAELALYTGVFQGVMPIFGYYLTGCVLSYISQYAKLIVFLIFAYLGIKFILEGLSKREVKPCSLSLICLLMIGIGTSIDAFSAGISLMLSGNYIMKPALLIAGITFLNSILGFLIGENFRKLPDKILLIIAGMLLLLLGIKALV